MLVDKSVDRDYEALFGEYGFNLHYIHMHWMYEQVDPISMLLSQLQGVHGSLEKGFLGTYFDHFLGQGATQFCF